MTPVSTGSSINTHEYLGFDAMGTTGITKGIFLDCLPHMFMGIKYKNIFIPTGIYDKVNSTLEDPRAWDTRGVKLSALRAGI